MNTEPLVSVIIPCYNSAKFLSEAVYSVLGQTYSNLEIIIVDDSSTDNSYEIAKKFENEDKRVKAYRIPHAGRPSVPRNFGIQRAGGELIAFIDSDDLWTMNKLERQVSFFRKMPGLTFVYSMSVTFGKVSIFSPSYEVLPLHFRAAHNYNDLLTIGNTIPLSSVLADSNKLREEGGFDEDPELKVEDYDLWLRIGRKGSFVFIPRILVYYRIHGNQFSSDWDDKSARLKYLAEKRNLPLPEYKFFRRKKVLRILRNLVHLQSFIWVKILAMMDRTK